MAAMDMDDDDDIWANTSSPSGSPPQPASARGFISTQLSLNSHHLHLLSSAGAAPGQPGGIYAADAICHHVGLGGAGFRNAAASPAPFFAYGLDAGPAPLDAGPVHGALEREMCLGPAAAAWTAGPDRRKKRMMKNRESAARSRARKQAYVRELEREVKHLQQENQSLRVKYEQLRVSTEVPLPLPVKKTLRRMPSAPF